MKEYKCHNHQTATAAIPPHAPLSSQMKTDPDTHETHLSQTVPGPIGPGPHFSTHLPSLYLPTIPHCRQIRCPCALVAAKGTVTAGVPASSDGPEPGKGKMLASCPLI